MRIPNLLFSILLLAFSFPLAAQAPPCEIYDLVAEPGDCTSDSTYLLELEFKVKNPTSDYFDLWGNGAPLGTYKLSDLPLKITNFPSTTGIGGYVKVCMKTNNPSSAPCCAIKQFIAPNCSQPPPCEIYDVKVGAGDCIPGTNKYKIKLDFKVVGATNSLFEIWAGNGQYLGYYPLNQVPLTLDFPGSGGPVDKIRICINDNPNCCRQVEFQAPACPPVPCNIENLRVETGECTSDSTYKLLVSFKSSSVSTTDSFNVYAANGKFLGRFAYANLPITFPNYPWGGNNVDAVKICISNTCCRTKEFNVPDCFYKPCGIGDMKVDVGDCITQKTYRILLNFNVILPAPGTNVKFGVWAGNGDFLGTYGIGDLPLKLDFPRSGDATDQIKVCLLNADGVKICCKIIEFKPPVCPPPCPITDLKVEVGPCNSDGTYAITINLKNTSTTPGAFGVWAGNGKFLGIFPLTSLPLKIAKFPASGNPNDVVKVCLIGTTNTTPVCCLTAEFAAPDCTHPCNIFDLNVEAGPCNNDGTYSVYIKFGSTNTTGQFGVWAGNGQFLGLFPLSALPLKITNFPASGKDYDAVKVCVFLTSGASTTCCLYKEFKAPDCGQKDCEIYDLKVETGPCNTDGTYKAVVNFKVQNPGLGTHFVLWANGTQLGVYPLSALPLTIPSFPTDGGPSDYVKVCLINPVSNIPSSCCKSLEFHLPDCANKPCEIYDLKVDVGPCTSTGTFKVVVNFKVQNPGSDHFMLWANGVLQGTYKLSDLPLTIAQFPTNGGPNDYIKVCMVNAAGVPGDCCRSLEFPVPDCNNQPCEIYDLKVDVGPCNTDGTFKVLVNFKVQGPSSQYFMLWANGTLLGTYPLSALPLTIPNFPTDGGPNDVIKVCMVSAAGTPTNCCRYIEFAVPNCNSLPCEIYDLKAEAGPCNSDGTFKVVVNFKVHNPGTSTHFMLWANGTLVGTYPLSALPLTIPQFPTNGGPNDVIKVCLVNAAGASGDCCRTVEFAVPTCNNQPCEIYDLKVETGPCNNDGTFKAVVNFKVQNPGVNTHFMLWANGTLLGTYPLSSLPLTIAQFPTDGGPNDVIKVCIMSPNGTTPNSCCRTLEFPVPTCQTGPCEIYDLKVDVGPCNTDGTFKAVVNFKVHNPGTSTHFMLWANGTLQGTYPLSALPLTIAPFPTNGGPNDYIKVCLVNANGVSGDCCRSLEFAVPTCPPHPCEIFDLKVETGPCNNDGTYKVIINFGVNTPISSLLMFGVWANGQFLGTFPVSALPLTIPNFPTDGGPNDVIKVCMVTPGSTQQLCCKTLEFHVPDCANKPCKIYDLHVLTTPCLCGQFFALLQFGYENTGNGGFDVVGNGKNYGTFPYNTPQPIIIGPLDGDNKTEYEFVVRDHNHPDCQDVVELGKVDCDDQFVPGNTVDKMFVSPNPTSNWITVVAQNNSGTTVSQAVAEIRKADGRLVRSVVVPNAGNFQMDVSELPAGVYRLSLQTAEARMESTFVKQ